MPGKGPRSGKSRQEAPVQLTGVFIFANGEKYEGEYISVSNGLIERSGTGTHHLVSGIVYSGQWAQDKMNGKGMMQHPSGAKYEGEFVSNEYHGSGMYAWPDGSVYNGQFANNKLTGNGEYTDNSGHTWTGDFNERTANNLRLKLC